MLILFFQLFLLLAWCVQVIIINIGSILPLDGSKETDVGEIFFIIFFHTGYLCAALCCTLCQALSVPKCYSSGIIRRQ